MKSVCRNMSISSGALVIATMRTGSLPVLMCRCQVLRGEGNTAPFSHSRVIMSLGSRCQTWVCPLPERTSTCSSKMWRSALVRLPGGISHTHASTVPAVPSRKMYAPRAPTRFHGFSSTLLTSMIDVNKVELKPWKRVGALGAYIFLEGTAGKVDAWVAQLPPGTQTIPERHIFEEQILVLSG